MTLQLDQIPVDISAERLVAFCAKWRVRELALFGSVIRGDFGPDSDVDVLVTFADDAPWSLWDWADMTDELRAIVGRDVDLVEKDAVRNPYRRRAILAEQRVIYAA